MEGEPFFFEGRWEEEGKLWASYSPAEKTQWWIWNTIIWLVVIGTAILASSIIF